MGEGVNCFKKLKDFLIALRKTLNSCLGTIEKIKRSLIRSGE
jgi:hypothetical protein